MLVEDRVEFVVGFQYMLRDYPNLADHGHEVGIPAPPRHYMHVQMLLDSGTGSLPNIDTDVEALRVKGGS